MDLAEKAVGNRIRGDAQSAAQYFRQALEEETIALQLADQNAAGILTRAILYKSAAALALDCGEISQARQLVDSGLTLKPSESIAEEMKQIQEKINFTSNSQSDGEVAYLGADVDLKGSIKFGKDLIFAGRIEGEVVSADGTLIIVENAIIRGDVKSKIVIIKGRVHGNITVLERCELHSRSELIGDLQSPRLIIEEGATFVGSSEVTPNKAVLTGESIARSEKAAEASPSTTIF